MKAHRHRFEFNNAYRKQLEDAGLRISGVNPDRDLVEIIEIENHPWFLAVQFHPEFQSNLIKHILYSHHLLKLRITIFKTRIKNPKFLNNSKYFFLLETENIYCFIAPKRFLILVVCNCLG